MIQDNTVKWKVKKVSSLTTSNGIPVGFEYISMNPNIPQGSLPMFGGLYDRSVYADLWAWVQQQAGYVIAEEDWQSYFISNEGNVPFYSDGDGSTNFRVPSISCWVKGASGIEEVSSYYDDTVDVSSISVVEDGLHYHGATQPSGYTNHNFMTVASTTTESTGRTQIATGTSGKYVITYNTGASDYVGTNDMSDSKYTASSGEHTHTLSGGSNETKPKTIVGMWLVKAYGTISNVGNVETADILNAVENSKIMLKVW